MSSIEERWNCIFKLKHTFGILLSYTFVWKWYQDHCLLIYSQNVSLKFQSILKVHFSFTSTEVWRRTLKVHFNIHSINEVHLPNIPLLYFFRKVQTKYTSNVLFFRKVNGCTFNLFLRPPQKREVSGTTKRRSVGLISLSQTTRIKLDFRTAWSFEWMNLTILFFVGYPRITLGSGGYFFLIDTEAALTQKKKCASLTRLRREPSVSIRKKISSGTQGTLEWVWVLNDKCHSVLQITLHVYTFPVTLVHNPAIPCGLIKEICKELIDFKTDVRKW